MSAVTDPWHSACAVLVLDTLTGCTGWERGISPYSWVEGSWSCDCNRGLALGIECSNDRECPGCRRFLAIACDWPEATFGEMNSDYPPALLEEFRPYWETSRADQAPAGADEGRGSPGDGQGAPVPGAAGQAALVA